MLRILSSLGLLLGFALAHNVSVFDSGSPINREVSQLFWITMGFAALIFVVVFGALIYSIVKFRARGDEKGEPPQFHGNDRLEILWTLIPLGIVAVLFALTAKSLFAIGTPPEEGIEVQVTGYQFWWDFYYPEYDIRTSNELIIPVGRAVKFEVTSKDVIHSFWAPNLGGKIDAIPGVTTHMWFEAEKPGVYYGQCAELCGASHANMRFRVIAVPEEEFEAFVKAAQAYTAPEPVSPREKRGQELFAQNCAGCHRVQGTTAQGTLGPDLSYFGNRLTVGAGIWPNEPAYLKPWIANSPEVKPGSEMPAFPHLTEEDVDAIVAYLDSLRLEGFDFSELPKR